MGRNNWPDKRDQYNANVAMKINAKLGGARGLGLGEELGGGFGGGRVYVGEEGF